MYVFGNFYVRCFLTELWQLGRRMGMKRTVAWRDGSGYDLSSHLSSQNQSQISMTGHLSTPGHNSLAAKGTGHSQGKDMKLNICSLFFPLCSHKWFLNQNQKTWPWHLTCPAVVSLLYEPLVWCWCCTDNLSTECYICHPSGCSTAFCQVTAEAALPWWPD